MIAEEYPKPPGIIDIRASSGRVHHGVPVRKRSIKSVTGICLHQTAAFMTESADRFRNMGAHFGVFTDGRIVWCHDMDLEVCAANGWNTATVSIEFNGRFEGQLGNLKTLWDDPSTKKRELPTSFTQPQAEAGRNLIRWICSDAQQRGGDIRALVAHRQASADRRNDPGELVWRQVALPLNVELGLTDGGVGFTLGHGLAIPEDWDPRCKGIKY